MKKRRPLLFILSNREGRSKNNLVKGLLRFCRKSSAFDGYVAVTQHQKHLLELTENFAQDHPDGWLFVAGGDGSLSEAADAVVRLNTGTSFGAIPAGTANDFCKMLYHNFDLRRFLHALPLARVEKIDMIRLQGDLHLLADGPESLGKDTYATERYSLNITGLGIDSQVLRKVYEILARHPRLGAKAYYWAILRSLGQLNTRELRFSIDGEEREMQTLLFAICNGSFYGNGFQPAPGANLQDGQLRYCVSPRLRLRCFLRLLKPFRDGSIVEQPDVLTGCCQQVHLETVNGERILGNFDGSLFETRSLDFSIAPSVLPFIFVPHDSVRGIETQEPRAE